jgi:hypothetical protein
MKTECIQKSFEFQALAGREVVGRFDGGRITSDAGGVLLREVEQATGILQKFAACFEDHRDPDLIEHTTRELLSQRVYGLALGYEDLNDHDDLRHDPLLAVLVGKADPSGADRLRERDRGKALAGKSTLNRLELTPVRADADSRYKKIVAHQPQIERLFVDIFLAAHRRRPRQIVLDLDATDDPVHGSQLGRFFHGYYGHYCYLPLYIFAGEHLLCAKLRPADIDGASGAIGELQRIVGQIRARWPRVRIIVRGDSGFCRENLLSWCECNQVDYVIGLAKNSRLLDEIELELYEAWEYVQETGQAARVFRDFQYQTLETWSRSRRVVGKAEQLPGGPNPRFIVSSLSAGEVAAQPLYEAVYCARGDMENRIKEQQLGLFADRTSAATMRANQLRLWFSSVAYTLMSALRRLGLAGTSAAGMQCDTLRLKLLKIGAVVRVTVRKVWLSFSEAYPYKSLFAEVYTNLRLRARPPSAGS